MSGQDPGAYGETSGPRDGESQGYRPIPTPPPAGAQPPAPSAPMPAASRSASVPDQGRHAGAGQLDRMGGVMAAAMPVATIVFILLGFLAHAWAWAWVVFLIPPALMAYRRGSRG